MAAHEKPDVTLEPAARELADATANPPFLYELGPDAARKVLDDLQSGDVVKPAVDDEWLTVPAAVGDVPVRIVKPAGATGTLPVILYVHGGGWILGNAGTHDRLVREFATGVGAAVVFVEYTRSPEAHYPVAIEQAYATAQWVGREGAAKGLDASRMAVAGDSVGGNMTAALALMAKNRGDVTFVQHSLYYPVTDAGMDTESYHLFEHGPFLTAKAMEWFWDAYLPDPAERKQITASPLQASLEQLAGLPPAFLIVDEYDVLRDEGEAYAAKLRLAGVAVTTVRYDGILHDFMMLDPVRDTHAAKAATAQAIAVLREALH
ncbi:alpha/beta hydrolase [Amycolatopsis rhabdoformis]|uniref:Alpha/beta hydrolase n=1 Tax=Amycolatopsis rhabdoformis TaxID=1448059 RepID=A0ABZ1IBC4_9PSEU|nr:alpha/beta hydrolase [Amycolatopsis rhabdoformis]WSE31769.1 alpha/beta hydrolase [Amycolatopsis rhabdoformis]